MPSVEAEDRIMIAVEKVGKKVDDLRNTTGEFQLVTAVAIAKIQQIEASCPISKVQSTLDEVKSVSDQNRRDMGRLAAMIAGGITIAMGLAHMVIDWIMGRSA